MSLKLSIAKNTLIHTLGKFSGSALGLFIIGLLTRYLGPEGYGYYTTVFSYLFFFSTIGDLGLYLVSVNELGRDNLDQKRFYSNIFTMRFFSSLFFMFLAGVLIFLFPYDQEIKNGTLIIAIPVFLMMLDQILVALFQQQLKTKYPALAEICGKIIILALTLIVIRSQAGFLTVLLTVVAGTAVHFLINFYFARKILSFSFAFDKNIWRDTFKKVWPVATYMVFSMIYFKADTIILSLYRPQSEVGIYGAPYKILEVLIAFPAIFMGLVSPYLSRAWSLKNQIEFQNFFQKAFDFLSLIVCPMVLGTIILANPLIMLIAGDKFIASAGILRILIVATGIIFWAHLSTFAVVAVNRQKTMMKYYVVAALSALSLYFIFIPRYSYWAAALITVFVEAFILVASWANVRQETKIKIKFKNSFLSFLASLVMATIIFFSQRGLLLSIVLGGVVYFSSLYFFGVFKKGTFNPVDFIKGKNGNHA